MIHIDTSALKAALNTLKPYVTTKGTLSAILSSVLVEYSDSQGLRISATDLSQSACLDVGAVRRGRRRACRERSLRERRETRRSPQVCLVELSRRWSFQ